MKNLPNLGSPFLDLLMEAEAVEVEAEHPGILEVPEGKNVEDLPLNHFVKVSKKKGRAAVSKALVNLERWNKNRNRKLSNWAAGILKQLKAYFEKNQ